MSSDEAKSEATTPFPSPAIRRRMPDSLLEPAGCFLKGFQGSWAEDSGNTERVE